MAHSHDQGDHPHEQAPGPDRKKKMTRAVFITAAILLLEAVGGVWSGSLALLTDAGHMLTDLAALLISLTAMILAERPISRTHTFGLARLEVLAALGNSLTFFLMVFAVAWQAGVRLAHPSLPDWRAMGLVAAIGFAANASSAWFLHGADQQDINLQGAWIHVLGDLASSLGVLIGVLVIAQTGWTWVDPLLSLLIALLIAASAFKLFRKALRILLEASPRGLAPEAISGILRGKIPEIREVHHVHLWEVGAGQVYLTAHLVVEDAKISEAVPLLERAQSLLKAELQIDHSTFQLEVRTPSRIAFSEKPPL
ncbi:MAG TPA: cation diffusion facilitator family transporter [bacterium]|nr:cation diffusion facilitator family transporter [bacterium]